MKINVNKFIFSIIYFIVELIIELSGVNLLLNIKVINEVNLNILKINILRKYGIHQLLMI